MPYAAGVFSLVAGNPVVTGTIISSTWANNTLTDISTGLSTAVLKDGTQTTTSLVPFAQGIAVVANASTSSFYQAGTWTPSIRFGGTVSGMSGVASSGSYEKHGKVVTTFYNINLTTKGSASASGFAVLTGFPFPSASTSLGPTAPVDWQSLTSTMMYVGLTMGNASEAAIKGTNTVTANLGQLRATDFSGSDVLSGSLVYIST